MKTSQRASRTGTIKNADTGGGNLTIKEVPAMQVAAEKSQALVRGGITAGTPGQLVRYWNRWRENYNALVGLTMQRVRALLEQSQRGDMAYPQWTYRIVERRHPVLKSLLDCCESPMENFKWDIRIKKELPEGFTEAQAKTQQAALKSAYAQVDNVREGLVHLALADFRGYSHIQKHYLDGEVTHFECLFQYCVCRDGLFGDWFWNPDSKSLTMPEYVLSANNRIGSEQLPREDFIIREVERPIDEIALENFVRRKLIEKDWSAFDEIFGIPSGVVTMPANVPPGQETAYEQSAKMIAEGGSGAIPNGASYTANDMPRDGSNLFKNHIAQLDEDLVLAGTGGKLKMLVQQGPGEKRGSAQTQDDTFDEISRARGNKAAQSLHQDFDIPFLTKKFPTQPALVEFCLVTEDETNVDSLCTNVGLLKTAGKNVKTDWLADQTGYEFEDDDQEPDPNANPNPEPGNTIPNPGLPAPIKNREGADDMAATIHEALMPILDSLDAIRKIDDPELQRRAVEGLLKNMPHLETIILQNKTLANKLLPELVDALVSGLKPATKNRILNGDVPGHEFHGNQYADVAGEADLKSSQASKSQTTEAHTAARDAHNEAAKLAPNATARNFHEHMASHHQRMNDVASEHSARMNTLLQEHQKALAPLQAEKDSLVKQIKTTKASAAKMLRQQKREEN